MLKAQILALLLIPFFSGTVPLDRAAVSPFTVLGFQEQVTQEFLVGAWRSSDEFFKWGATDKEKSKIRSSRGSAVMKVESNGEIRMENFFKPTEGRWEITPDGISISDPRFPDRTPQLLPIRKRDDNRIWILLPFTNGSVGIGMVRVTEEELKNSGSKTHPGVEIQRTRRERIEPRQVWRIEPSTFTSNVNEGSDSATVRREFTRN